ncbi:HNH endonuclease family protein [Phascolarctobacterium sp. Marseille-Q4147]
MTDTDQERLYEEYWLTVQNLLPDKLLDNFFIDYLNMKSDGFVKESEAYKSFKQVYVEGKYDNEKMLQEILHYAKQYYVFCYGSSDFGAEVNKALAGLRKLKQTTVYLFLFRVFDDYENGIINKNELARVLKMLLSYSIRRLVCEIGSNTLRGLYKTLYGRVFEQKENKNTYYDSLVSFFLQQTSKNTIPSDNEFVTALQEKNLYSKNALCKYLLCAIENQGKETLDTENLSIEHIMPQNKNLSMSWQKMLGENWQSVHEKYLHTLGNLTLTGYNSELGDKPFEKKKEKLEETITHIAVLYSDVKDKSEWNSVNMEKRAKRLAEIILKLFPIEQPKTKIEFTDPHYKLYTLANPDDATYKTVNYFEFLGERVNVSSFAEMVRSIAQILYDMDNSIIDDMAKKHEPLPEWTTPAFSYEEDGVRNPFKLRNCNIYISTGYSASACIFFIRGLMKKYEFDISEDFVYSAKPNNTSIN